MFIVSVIVESNCSHSAVFTLFNVSALLLDDTLKPAMPLNNRVINETLRQIAPLCDDTLEVWWDL